MGAVMTRLGRPPWPEKAERLHRYALMRRDPTVTIAEIARRLDVSRRTVERYSAELRTQETAVALSGQIEGAARTHTPALGSREEARASHVLHMPAGRPDAERDERWHAAHLIRARYRRPESWLACVGLSDVPTDPHGWCTCENGAA